MSAQQDSKPDARLAAHVISQCLREVWAAPIRRCLDAEVDMIADLERTPPPEEALEQP